MGLVTTVNSVYNTKLKDRGQRLIAGVFHPSSVLGEVRMFFLKNLTLRDDPPPPLPIYVHGMINTEPASVDISAR